MDAPPAETDRGNRPVSAVDSRFMNLSGSKWKAPGVRTSAAVARKANTGRALGINGPTVFVVDNNYFVRRELEHLIDLNGYRAESFASAEDFLRHGLNAQGASLLLAEVNLPGLNGPGLQNILLQHGVLLPIIFMTNEADIPTAIRALQSGAISFLCKPLDENRLMTEIENALAIWHDEFQQRCEIAKIQRCYSTLTPREREFFLLAADGCPSGLPRYQPGIVEEPAKAHQSRVMKKMHAQSEAELALMAQKLDALFNYPHSQWMPRTGNLFPSKQSMPPLLY